MKKFWHRIRILTGVILAILFVNLASKPVEAREYWHYGDNAINGCRDIEYIFVRGSGQERNEGEEWKEFERRMIEVSKYRHVSYRVTDLDYPAVAITAGNALGIYSSAGAATNFGESVWTGVIKLRDYVKHRSEPCSNSYFVLGGYSQGALVIQEALKDFPTDRVVYIGLFGDPKLYLPEGKGLFPPACYGRNYSRYRVMVSNCETDDGLLGVRDPYEQGIYGGRYGLFCNSKDFVCGSSKNPLVNDGHLHYVDSGAIFVMSRIVELRIMHLRTYLNIYSAKTVLSDSRDEIVLILPATDYKVVRDKELVFDASRSFATSGSPLNYSWWLDGRELDENSAELRHTFSDSGEHTIIVKASTAAGTEASKEIKVLVREADETSMSNVLPAPNVLATKRDDNSFRLSWQDWPDDAKAMAIRIGDVFLGYADISNQELIIGDYDFEKGLEISAAYMNYDGDLGEWVKLDTKDEDNAAALTSAEPIASRFLAIIMLPFAALGLVLSIIRLIEDIRSIKKRPKTKP